MIRAARTVLGTSVLTLLLVVGLTAPAALAEPSPSETGSPVQRGDGDPPPPDPDDTDGDGQVGGWAPPTGVAFNNPFGSEPRVLQNRVVRAIKETAPGQVIQIAVWNLDYTGTVRRLIEAKDRGVTVQVVVSGQVDNVKYTRLENELNADKTDDSFAVQCRGGCRSRTKIMHSKFYLFSNVNDTQHVSMFGSANMTFAAGGHQWNDLVTSHDRRLYEFLSQTFTEYSKDRAVANPYQQVELGKYRVTLYPVGDRNPQLAELNKVRCHGTTGGTGNGAHRTVLRLSVAGWFDSYGQKIANRVRQLWDQGCDIRILTTLAGRGINQTLKDPRGRGPVPIKKLTRDRNNDGIPETYSHMKSMSISGVYDGDTSASVVFTGSPNWSSRAARSEEIWVRLLDVPGIASKYERWINRWYFSSVAHARLSTRADLDAAFAQKAAAEGLTARSTQDMRDKLFSELELD